MPNNTVVFDGDLSAVMAEPGEGSLVQSGGGIASEDVVILDGDLSLSLSGSGDCALLRPDAGEAGIVTVEREGAFPTYTGPTAITPTQEQQVLSTANKSVLTEIVVNPIPSNYGLITWDGNTLTVS